MPLLIEGEWTYSLAMYTGCVLLLRLHAAHDFINKQLADMWLLAEHFDIFFLVFPVLPSYSLLIFYPPLFASARLGYRRMGTESYDVGLSLPPSRNGQEIYLRNVWSDTLYGLSTTIIVDMNDNLRIASQVAPKGDGYLAFPRLLPLFLL